MGTTTAAKSCHLVTAPSPCWCGGALTTTETGGHPLHLPAFKIALLGAPVRTDPARLRALTDEIHQGRSHAAALAIVTNHAIFLSA